jgi:16S rRNA G527 N7-methylase RsmG
VRREAAQDRTGEEMCLSLKPERVYIRPLTQRVEYAMTNQVLKFEAVLGRAVAAVPEVTPFALNCADEGSSYYSMNLLILD